MALSLSNGATAQGGPRPPSRVYSILPGLGRLFSNFYTLALLHLPPLHLPNAAWVSLWGAFLLDHWGGPKNGYPGWNSVTSSKSFHANFMTVNWIQLTNGFLPHPFQHIPKVWHWCTDFNEAHIQWTEPHADPVHPVWPKSGEKCWK